MAFWPCGKVNMCNTNNYWSMRWVGLIFETIFFVICFLSSRDQVYWQVVSYSTVVSKSFYCNILCYFVTFCWQKYQPSENKKGGGPSVIPYSLDTSLQTNLFRTTDLMSLKQSVQQAFLVLSWIQQKVQHPLLLVEDHHLHYPQSKCFLTMLLFMKLRSVKV